MNTSNPVLSSNAFSGFGYVDHANIMTMQGVVRKTAILLLITLLSAAWMWMHFFQSANNPDSIYPWMMGGVIGGLVLALVTTFKQEWASITAPFYALLEGLFIGGLSAIMEASFSGIAMQAVLLTFGTLFIMLAAYQSGLIRATERLKLGIIAATGGIGLLYVISMVLSFFNIQLPFIYGNGMAGIGFSLFVVVIAAFNFILDFDFIEQGSRRGLPKYMEWYGAFAMMVTLIWLYVEFLRLLAKMRSRD